MYYVSSFEHPIADRLFSAVDRLHQNPLLMLFQNRKVPLWSILVVPFVVQTFVAVGLVGYLAAKNGQEAVNDLASQLMDKTSQQVDDHLDAYLALPLQLTEMNIRAIASGDLDIRDPCASERYFWQQGTTFPTISYLGYGLNNGSEVGAGRWIPGLGVLLYENPPGANYASVYLADKQGNRIQHLLSHKYDPLSMNWYQNAVTAGKLTWAGVDTTTYPNPEMGQPGQAVQPKKNLELGKDAYVAMSASAPFYDPQGRLLGVMTTELLLTQLSNFLRTVKLSQGGQTFIVEHDRQGLLVASSTQQPIIYQQGDQVKRYTLFDSPCPLIRAIAPHLRSQTQDSTQHHGTRFEIELNQQRYYVQLTHWRDDKHGLDWLVVVTVPESDFMAQIDANTHQTVVLCFGALAIATLFGILTARWVTRPITALNQAAQAVATGNLNQQVADSPIQEMDAVGQSFNRMASQLHESFSQLEYTASHDTLTGLLNRAGFQHKLTEVMNKQIGASRRSSDLFAVLFLDLDFFKLVNDSLGHFVGDLLLIEVSQRLQSCLRAQDTLARLGGDEFVVLLEPIEHPSYATQIAERIIDELKKPFLLNDKTAFISTSIGIVLGTAQINDPDSMLRNADIALYRAKANGKAVYEVFDDQMHTEVLQRLQLETELRQILDQCQGLSHNFAAQLEDERGKDSSDPSLALSVHYQPVVDTHTLEMRGLEALLRWNHPTLGMISPDKFIPIAEETGLIVPLGYWVLRQACQQMVQWQQQFPQTQSVQISVNLSPRQFLQPDLDQQIAKILQETGLIPASLKLEITESLLISDRPSMQTRLNQLKALGVKISLDDFGTGYSALSYLQHFPLDTLKIDRSFIHQMTTDAKSMAVVESITTLAHNLGLNVVAEGVETQTQLDYLRQIAQCEQIQGFLIAPAQSADVITEWMGDRQRTW
ncbi:MAG: EAL domain-containing protein [Aphanocapsa sp. GSE-SYN-MK-11-07L]|nr:EAL domain-containing protein [Aphanocapsa sp. GSE-SYN-MK-11-07L]